MNEVVVINRIGISGEKRGLIDELMDHFGVNSTGLCILLDDSDHEKYINKRYCDRAFYMDIVDGGIEEMSPDYVLDAMNAPSCLQFIWLSRRACLGSLAGFTWTLAHELQHLVQRTSDKLVAQINGLLRRAYPQIGQPNSLQIDFPAEFDAELGAREAVQALLGDTVLNKYLSEQRESEAGQRYFDRFHCIEQDWSGDLRIETLRVLCARKEEYARFKDSLDDPEFEFEIDALCREHEHLRG